MLLDDGLLLNRQPGPHKEQHEKNHMRLKHSLVVVALYCNYSVTVEDILNFQVFSSHLLISD